MVIHQTAGALLVEKNISIIARSALYVPLPKNVPWTDSVLLLLLLLLRIIITFCGRQMGCVTALLPFGSLKEIF